MKIAYVVFDGITLLDFIGVYDPISRLKSMNYLPDLSWDICSLRNPVKDSFDLKIVPSVVNSSLSGYDVLIVPGGFGIRELQFDKVSIEWIQTARHAKCKISICTGSLLLGAAGFLTNKTATTNYQNYEDLKPYCKQISYERIVEDGDVVTAGAVSASIDLGLFCCEKWAGKDAAVEVRKKMDYRG